MSHNKYLRHQSVISRYSDSVSDENNWLSELQKSLTKDAVQSRKVDDSLFNQINSIINNKSKYPTVDAAVEDMKQRSGLTDYLNKINKTSTNEGETVKKIAQNNVSDATPTIIKKVPAIKQTIENFIRDTKGNISIPAIVDRIRSIHQNDIADSKDWDDENLLKYISRLNLLEKQKNPSNFENHSNLGTRDVLSDGEIDPSNTDAFYALNPVKY